MFAEVHSVEVHSVDDQKRGVLWVVRVGDRGSVAILAQDFCVPRTAAPKDAEEENHE